jgi:hypothetical protein
VFYTYSHATPQGRLFYIGKGQGKRAHQLKYRNDKWKKVVAKYGQPTVQILAHWKTEAEALDHEMLLISCFKDMGYDLANLTEGGEGTSGYKHTPEQIEKNRLAKLGSIPWNKGISSGLKHSEEFKEKIRQTHKGNKYNLGRPTSAKQKEAARKLFKGNKYAAGNTAQRKWIWVGTHIETGEVIRLIGEKALKEAGFQHANIIKCINGTRKSHKGYTWSKEKWEDKSWH